jgi:hypothetical protein
MLPIHRRFILQRWDSLLNRTGRITRMFDEERSNHAAAYDRNLLRFNTHECYVLSTVFSVSNVRAVLNT